MSELHLEPFDASRCRSIRTALERWYAREGRSLPWRETADPYRIWISEIMLQQTTVKAVVPFYERFLARFPDVHSLAAASEAEVLQYWEGLGYYSRGRNLRLAAQQIRDQYSGEFPSDLDELQGLPGIGRYTAGAIRSFGFNLPAPIVEANTLRLYCRLLGYAEDPRSRAGQQLLWEFAERLQPKATAGHLNQALMELGAVICTPATPRCWECPVRRWCLAFQSGEQEHIPLKQVRPQVTQLVEGTLGVRSADRWLLRQRQPGERWAGLWDFPRFPVDSIGFQEKLTSRTGAKVAAELAQSMRKDFGIEVDDLHEVMQVRHTVTRYRIRLLCLTGEIATAASVQGLAETAGVGMRWVTLEELKELPMPVTGRQFAERLAEQREKGSLFRS